MSKVIDLPRKPRAPVYASKLEAARDSLHALESEVGPARLAAEEGAPNAAKGLADLRSKIAAAEREVDELEKAHALAAKLDRQSDATAAAAMRAEQFAVMKQHAAARLKALETVMAALATAAKAYSEYAIETNAMVVAVPTGTHMGFVALGRNGYGRSWLGDLKALIAAEAFRLTVADEHGRGARLPFAKQPELTSDDPGAITPAIDVFTEAQEAVLRDIEAQMQRLSAEAMTAAGEAA